MLALSQDLSSVRSRWLDQVVVPHLAAQSLRVGESSASRKSANAYSRATGSSEARSDPTCTPPVVQRACSPSQAEIPRKPSGCYSQSTIEKLDPQLAAGTERTAMWKTHGAETCDSLFDPPFRDKQRTRSTSDNTFEASRHRCDSPDIQTYLERLRAILGTAVGGLFSPQACHLLVELVVSRNPLYYESRWAKDTVLHVGDVRINASCFQSYGQKMHYLSAGGATKTRTSFSPPFLWGWMRE